MSRLPARTAHALAALTLSLACGAAFAQAPEGAASAPSAADEPAVESLLDPSALKILASAPRVVVAGFRVAFVTRNAASAHSRSAFSNLGHSAGGGMRTVTQAAVARVDVALQNVDDARMQAIVERAYADFMAALQATGRPVVPLAEMQASAGWQQLEFTPTDKPYVTSPTGTQKHYRFAAPQALPLWFGHFDAPLGDRAPFSLGNWRALNQLSVDTGAVVIVPQLVVDFADLSSSGNSMWRRQAEVGAKSGMSIEAANSKLLIFHAKIAMAGDLGSATPEGRPGAARRVRRVRRHHRRGHQDRHPGGQRADHGADDVHRPPGHGAIAANAGAAGAARGLRGPGRQRCAAGGRALRAGRRPVPLSPTAPRFRLQASAHAETHALPVQPAPVGGAQAIGGAVQFAARDRQALRALRLSSTATVLAEDAVLELLQLGVGACRCRWCTA